MRRDKGQRRKDSRSHSLWLGDRHEDEVDQKMKAKEEHKIKTRKREKEEKERGIR